MVHPKGRVGALIDSARQWVTIVLIVLVLVLGYQVSRLQNTVSHVQDASQAASRSSAIAATAATAAKTTLEDAVGRAQGGQIDPVAVGDALKSIRRIETAVCGGPCPDK